MRRTERVDLRAVDPGLGDPVLRGAKRLLVQQPSRFLESAHEKGQGGSSRPRAFTSPPARGSLAPAGPLRGSFWDVSPVVWPTAVGRVATVVVSHSSRSTGFTTKVSYQAGPRPHGPGHTEAVLGEGLLAGG